MTDQAPPNHAPGTLPPRQLPPRQPTRTEGIKNTVLSLLAAAMFLGLLVAAGVWTLPVLVSDWQVRNTAQPLDNARMTKGSCDSRLILHICDATLTVDTPRGRITRDVNYVFTGFHLGDYSAAVMADPARPDLVTTDLGLDNLWNRTITLLVAAGLIIAMVAGGLLAVVRKARGPKPA